MMSTPITFEDFDFIKLLIYDIHGIARGRMVAKRRLPGIIKDGLAIGRAVCYFGICDQFNGHPDFDHSLGFKTLRPVLDTLVPCPMVGDTKYRTGQLICDLEYPDGRQDTSSPRTAAVVQLEKLKSELGLTIKSAFEMEFTIRHSQTKEYLGHVSKWATVSVVESCQDILMDIIEHLSERGIHVDAVQSELGPGQFEFTIDVAEGIEAADKTANFKHAVKTLLKSKGYDASFMTAVDPDLGSCNGYHHNHSLWTSDGKNAFLDTSQPTRLSELGSHWIAGLIEHTPALLAFCCPTTNCFRRLGDCVTPASADWGTNNRKVAYNFRVMPGNVYIENRLPASACNPYLVTACVVAAGIDGIKRQLPLPEEMSKDLPLPKDISSALQALEEDTVLVDALGTKLVEYYVHNKRTFEVQAFEKFGNLTNEQQLRKEREMYFLNA